MSETRLERWWCRMPGLSQRSFRVKHHSEFSRTLTISPTQSSILSKRVIKHRLGSFYTRCYARELWTKTNYFRNLYWLCFCRNVQNCKNLSLQSLGVATNIFMQILVFFRDTYLTLLIFISSMAHMFIKYSRNNAKGFYKNYKSV